MTWWWFAAAGYQTILQPGSAVKMAFGSVPFVLFYSLLCFLPSQTYIFLGAFIEGRVIIPFGYGYTCKKVMPMPRSPSPASLETSCLTPLSCLVQPDAGLTPKDGMSLASQETFVWNIMERSIEGFVWPKSSQWDDNTNLDILAIIAITITITIMMIIIINLF